MSRILVAYYTRTGCTGRVATRLAEALDAQLLQIEETRSRLGPLGYMRCCYEAVRRRVPSIEPVGIDPGRFELLVIGTPIWCWHLSSPVRAFARREGRAARRVAFFCTMGGAGYTGAFDELRTLLGQEPVATLALTDAEIDNAAGTARIERFVQALRHEALPELHGKLA
ncbi:flavodoxin family protein [Azohydromonas caseinilytica]|uniref:Flavodoxin n=1 Tax=Azohydromonas caseinilytica TaxID=2728836 RepID=A0A848FFQ6_9BURK|nr:flavodoxin [Azohydromonas caseinilytica]NML18204.1 flavodoxin [Azohydromonas caseinilytica]